MLMQDSLEFCQELNGHEIQVKFSHSINFSNIIFEELKQGT